MKRGWVWLLVCLLGVLTACESDPAELSAGIPTPTLSVPAEPTIDTEIAPLPPAEGDPTYISVSQFPVAVLDTASAQQPAFVSIEMAGFDISELTWHVGRYEEGCNHLVGTGLLLPETGQSWPDGVHHASFSWPAVGYFLSDAERADFVYLEVNGPLRTIAGRFRQAAAAQPIDANLVVDPAAGLITGLQSITGEPLTAAAGDTFQLYDRCLDSNGVIRSGPGVELIFLEGGQLNLEHRPLTSGDYFLHLVAASAENSASSTTSFPVNNDALIPDHLVYLNSEYGFQFLYPAGWLKPQLQGARLVTADSDSATNLTITIHPGMTSGTPADLKNRALAQFGSVFILFEDQVLVNDTGALWTAYGYTGNEGAHTGVLLTFIRDGVGYTVDMDGLETAEEQTITLMNNLIENWLFRPDITTPRAREWTAATFDGLAMPITAAYYEEELDNGWRRFTVGDGISFLAVRTTDLEDGLFGENLSDIVERWQEVAARGVTDFAVSDAYTFSLKGREWIRTDFAYVGGGSLEIQGFVMAAEIDGRAVIFWAEMPITRYEEQSARFLLSLAGLR